MSAEFLVLEDGPLYSFRSWPNPDLPQVGAGVYTIWQADGRFIYAGMAGKSLDAAGIEVHRAAGLKKPKGLAERLKAHASGFRSGDQFCVYICDRFVVPQLSAWELAEVGAGNLSLDLMTRDYIQTNLSYRFIELESGKAALAAEAAIRNGALRAGQPFLNPTAGVRSRKAAV